MRTIRFVPGHVISTAVITIPTAAPDIDAVVAAEITRMVDTVVLAHGASVTPVAHGDGVAVGHANMAVADHDPHAHDLISLGTTVPPTVPIGWDAIPPTQLEDGGAAALHTFGGGAATGVQDGALSAHGVTQPDDHPEADIVAALADHGGAAIAAALIDHAPTGVTPVVPVLTVTKDTTRTFHLGVDTELGDLLTLSYHEVGERVLAA